MNTRRRRILCILTAMIITIAACTATGYAGAKEHYFGKTASGKSIYYVEKSITPYAIETPKKGTTEKKWKAFTKGAVDMGMAFASWKVGLTYAALCNILGVSKDKVTISHETTFYNEAQMHSIKERRFYIYTNKDKTNKRYVYTDQYGKGDINFYIKPVGKGLKTKCLKSKDDITLKTKYFDDKEFIKNRCQVNYNHKGKEKWSLNNEVMSLYFE